MAYLSLLAIIFGSGFTGCHASSLDDFSNNLATDIGPLLQLFGEPVTRQYLSECTTFLDYFIFATVPIGILTAMVSVIRVCGDSSLRAFIGQAQEADGQIEAELCTSTSRDVCELFNNKGGVARVLGRPNILEVIHVTDSSTTENTNQNQNPSRSHDDKESNEDSDRSILLFRDHLQRLPTDGEWQESGLDHPGSVEEGSRDSSGKRHFPSNPNLSLNVGIVRVHRYFFYLVAALGFFLQSGLLVMAAVVSWSSDWATAIGTESSTSIRTATVTYICGSFFMCLGMFLCAALIGQSTKEFTFKRKHVKGKNTPHTHLFWLQPGRQVVGDETFDSFAYSEEGDKHLSYYIISQKDLSRRFEISTWITIIITLGGYIAQFIGLRGMTAYISIAQLGSTLLMSFLRGCLRMQRLKADGNKLVKVPDKVLRHELDWLAFEIGARDIPGAGGRKSQFEPSHWLWFPSDGSQGEKVIDIKSPAPSSSPQKLFRYRSRLAVLTGHPDRYIQPGSEKFQQWEEDQVRVRNLALRLRDLVERSVEALFRGSTMRVFDSISFELPITMMDDGQSALVMGKISMTLRKPSDSSRSNGVLWTVDSRELEAVLGLWLWSLQKGSHLETNDEYGNKVSVAGMIPNYRITGLVEEGRDEEMQMWLGRTYPLSSHTMMLSTSEFYQFHSMSLWVEDITNIDVFIPWKPTSSFTKINIKRPPRRLFGWTALNTSVSEQVSLDGEPRLRAIPINCLAVGMSPDALLNQCGQELFASLMKHLFKAIKPDLGEVTVLDCEGRLRWQNPKISTIVSLFENSGLGSSIDAFICLLPPLRQVLRPPEGELMISDLLGLSTEYRKRLDWERAEKMLQWACNHYRSAYLPSREAANRPRIKDRQNFKSVLIVTGELYRWAVMHSDIDRRLFGYRGIEWMCHLKPDPQNEVSMGFNLEDINDINNVLDRYQEISSRFAEDRGETTMLGTYKDFGKYESMSTELEYCKIYQFNEKTRSRNEIQQDTWNEDDRIISCNETNRDAHSSIEDCESLEEDTDHETEWQHIQNVVPLKKKRGHSHDKSQLDSHANLDDRTRGSKPAATETEQRKEWCAKTEISERTRILCQFPSIKRQDISKGSLSHASYHGWIEVVAAFLELRADVNERDDQSGRTALHFAAEQAHFAIAKYLLAHGAKQDEADESKRTPLLLATMAQAEDIVELLLATGRVSTSTQDVDLSTPLIVAAKEGGIGIATKLAHYKALHHSNLQDKSGRTAIWYAAKRGDVGIVKLLLSHADTKVDFCDKYGITPLAVAGWAGEEEIFQLIYSKSFQNADPNRMLSYPCGLRRTMLSIAIEKDFKDIFKALLLDNRLDLRMRQASEQEVPYSDHEDTNQNFQSPHLPGSPKRRADFTAVTALGLAIQYNREGMFDWLLKYGRECLDELIEKPLEIAAYYGRISMVKKLLSNPNFAPNVGEPLTFAVSRKHANTVEALLQNVHSELSGKQLLLNAINCGSRAVIQKLLADPRIKPNEDDLETAFQSKRFKIAWLLFQHVNNPDMTFHDYDRGNALHVAAHYGKVNFTKSLLGLKDINLNLLNNKGHTPLSTAFSTGCMQVAALLLADKRTDVKKNDISRCPWPPSPDLGEPPRGNIIHFALSLRDWRAEAALSLLLKHPQLDLNAADDSGKTPLAFLLELDGPDEIIYAALQILLDDSRVNIAEVASDGRTPLHLGAESGHGIEQLLRREGVDPNRRNLAGQTPLHAASTSGTYQAIKALLSDSRTDPTIRDKEGRTAFDVLDINAFGKSAALFFSDGRFDNWRSQGGTTALHIIAKHWHIDMKGFLVRILESEKIDPNQRDFEGQTALWIAVRCGHLEAVDILLSTESINPNLPDSHEKMTALHLLAKASMPAAKIRKMLASFFVNPRLDPNVTTLEGQTALHVHLISQTPDRIKLWFVRAFTKDDRTDLNVQDARRQTALHLAARRKELEPLGEFGACTARIIQCLLEDERINPNLRDFSDQTAFQILMSDKYSTQELRLFVSSFLRLPALNPNVSDSHGQTALHLLAGLQPKKRNERQLVKIIKKLLGDSRIDFKIVDNKQQTPLHCAAKANFVAATKLLLLNSSLDPNAADVDDNTALHLAVGTGNEETVEAILRCARVKRGLLNGDEETAVDQARKKRTGSDKLVGLFMNIRPQSIGEDDGVGQFESSSDESMRRQLESTSSPELSDADLTSDDSAYQSRGGVAES